MLIPAGDAARIARGHGRLRFRQRGPLEPDPLQAAGRAQRRGGIAGELSRLCFCHQLCNDALAALSITGQRDPHQLLITLHGCSSFCPALITRCCGCRRTDGRGMITRQPRSRPWSRWLRCASSSWRSGLCCHKTCINRQHITTSVHCYVRRHAALLAARACLRHCLWYASLRANMSFAHAAALYCHLATTSEAVTVQVAYQQSGARPCLKDVMKLRHKGAVDHRCA